jgi:hypothetical protein
LSVYSLLSVEERVQLSRNIGGISVVGVVGVRTSRTGSLSCFRTRNHFGATDMLVRDCLTAYSTNPPRNYSSSTCIIQVISIQQHTHKKNRNRHNQRQQKCPESATVNTLMTICSRGCRDRQSYVVCSQQVKAQIREPLYNCAFRRSGSRE